MLGLGEALAVLPAQGCRGMNVGGPGKPAGVSQAVACPESVWFDE